MSLKLLNIIYYILIIITASLWSMAVDWRPGVDTGLVIHEEFIWWAIGSLIVSVVVYLYRRALLKNKDKVQK